MEVNNKGYAITKGVILIELNKIYNDDCMNILPLIPDKFFELAIVDVPYGIDEGGKKNASRSKLAVSKAYIDYDDSNPPDMEYFNQLFRVSKNQIIFGANHFISKIPYDSSCWIIWDKENGNTDQADAELAWTSFDSAARLIKYRWQGMLQGNMKQKEKRIHPNQKPVHIYKWILKEFAKPNDKIIDTHSGSASLFIACLELGFQVTAIEKLQHYYNESILRIKEYQNQLDAFNTYKQLAINF